MDGSHNSPYLTVRSLSSPLATSGTLSPRSPRRDLASSAPDSSIPMENEAAPVQTENENSSETTTSTSSESTTNPPSASSETATNPPSASPDSATTKAPSEGDNSSVPSSELETASSLPSNNIDQNADSSVDSSASNSSTDTTVPLKPSPSPTHIDMPVHVKTIAKKWLALTRSRRYSKKRSEKARSFAPLSPRVAATLPSGPIRAASLDTIMLEKHHAPISTHSKLGLSSGSYLRGPLTDKPLAPLTSPPRHSPQPSPSTSDSDVSCPDGKYTTTTTTTTTSSSNTPLTPSDPTATATDTPPETADASENKPDLKESPASPSVEAASSSSSESNVNSPSTEPKFDRRAMAMKMYNQTKTIGKPPPLAKLVSTKAKSETTLDQFLFDNIPYEQAEAAVLDLAHRVFQEQKGNSYSVTGPRNAPLTLEEAERIGTIVQEIHAKHLPLAYVTNPTQPYSIFVNKEKLKDLVKREFSKQSEASTTTSSSSQSLLPIASTPSPLSVSRLRGSLVRSSSATTLALSSVKSPIRTFVPTSPFIDSYAFQGGKKYMEDRIQIWEHLDLLLKLPYSASLTYVGIFDGHLGNEAAEIARVNTAVNIARNDNFGSDLQLALEEGFAKTNQDIISTGTQAGTTATVAFFDINPRK
eukprot:TRINITY_DN310_c0_g1_i4.p1 TRINITY_DN310_c0_g1~~TRINITY_DN310_c0_g1_i4.p1  ORF type:complete len:644 (-),score=111.10 TRINITY_DN310_c0_g1_i4:940-2871(-)